MSSDLRGKLEFDVDFKASAEQCYHMFKLPHHIPTATDKIQGVELLEGEWGTNGSVFVKKYFHDGKHRVSKERIEVVDDEKKSITFKVIEGDKLEIFKTIGFTLQITPKTDDKEGCVIHLTIEYEKRHEGIADPHIYADLIRDISKDFEAHLQKL